MIFQPDDRKESQIVDDSLDSHFIIYFYILLRYFSESLSMALEFFRLDRMIASINKRKPNDLATRFQTYSLLPPSFFSRLFTCPLGSSGVNIAQPKKRVNRNDFSRVPTKDAHAVPRLPFEYSLVTRAR